MSLFAADPLPRHLMYFKVSSGNKVRWIAIHGTSKLEGYHKPVNALLACENISPELAGALICHFNGRWNIDRGVQNLGDSDYGMYDHRWALNCSCFQFTSRHCSVMMTIRAQKSLLHESAVCDSALHEQNHS